MEKTTPLYQTHLAEGGKMVPFAGYLLPVQYPTGVIAEHTAVRTACGLFDVSHMGEVIFRGEGALATLNHLLTNDFTNMSVGRVRYTAMCLPDGGTVDDLVIYKFGEDCYLAVVNAANREKDYAHMAANLLPDTEIEDISDRVAQLALQGPNAREILAHLIDPELLPQKYYTAVREVIVAGIPCMISRTGYTGEFGYELYTAAEDGPRLWKLLREAGADHGLIPCGLGARDTLRLEAAMPLYGHEMNETITPAGSRAGLCRQAAEAGVHRPGCPAGGGQAQAGPRRAESHRPRYPAGGTGRVSGRGKDRLHHIRHLCPLSEAGHRHGTGGCRPCRDRHLRGGGCARTPRGRRDRAHALLQAQLNPSGTAQ